MKHLGLLILLLTAIVMSSCTVEPLICEPVGEPYYVWNDWIGDYELVQDEFCY